MSILRAESTRQPLLASPASLLRQYAKCKKSNLLVEVRFAFTTINLIINLHPHLVVVVPGIVYILCMATEILARVLL